MRGSPKRGLRGPLPLFDFLAYRLFGSLSHFAGAAAAVFAKGEGKCVFKARTALSSPRPSLPADN